MSLKFTHHARIAIGITIAVTALSAFAAQTCIIDDLPPVAVPIIGQEVRWQG